LRPLRRLSTLRGFGGFGAFCDRVGSASGSLGGGAFVSRSVIVVLLCRMRAASSIALVVPNDRDGFGNGCGALPLVRVEPSY
jgi:hypothetical protein